MPIPQHFTRHAVAFLSPAPALPVSGGTPATGSASAYDLPAMQSIAPLPPAWTDAPGAVTTSNRQRIMASGAPDSNELFRFASGLRHGVDVGSTWRPAIRDRRRLNGTSLAPRHPANYHMTEAQSRRLAANRSYRSPMASEQKSSMIFVSSAPPSPAHNGRTSPHRSEF